MDLTPLKLKAKSWAVALLLSAEARFIRLLDWCDRTAVAVKAHFAGYEGRARARLHAEELKATLKALHEHIDGLEKRGWNGPSGLTVRSAALLRKLEG